MSDTELIVRTCIAAQCEAGAADALDLDRPLFEHYGLTSLAMIALLTDVCERAAIRLTEFTEHDLGSFKTPRDILTAVGRLRRRA